MLAKRVLLKKWYLHQEIGAKERFQKDLMNSLLASATNASSKHIENGIVEEGASSASQVNGKGEIPWNLLTSELLVLASPNQAKPHNTIAHLV